MAKAQMGIPRMPKASAATGAMGGKLMGPRKPSMRVGGIRTNFTQGIAAPKLGKR